MSNWLQTQNQPLSDQQQKEMGKPLINPQGFDPADETFLNLVEDLIEKKKIDLVQPSSLLNHAVYYKLSEADQGKVDQQAILLLTRIREIHGIWRMSKEPTFQIANLINACRLYKEKAEAVSGDVFIV